MMKKEIDCLIGEILLYLKHIHQNNTPSWPFFELIRTSELSKAKEKRDILYRWSEDPTLTQDMRDYVKQQLATLPFF